nr:hypothetical protein [Ensifer sp. IC4062]
MTIFFDSRPLGFGGGVKAGGVISAFERMLRLDLGMLTQLIA